MSDSEKVERSPRKHLIYFVKVTSSNEDAFTGRLINISSSGLKMITKEKVFFGSTYRLEISLPEETNELKHITCMGKTVWCKHNASPERFSAGFEIVEIDDKNKNLLNELMKDFNC